jgi:hypothetical protein
MGELIWAEFLIYSLVTVMPITEIYSIILILIEPMKETTTVSVDCLAVAVCSVRWFW